MDIIVCHKDQIAVLFELQDIQREIKSLQGEILSMGKAAQELLAVTSADSHDLIRHSLGNLNDRVNILENQAREQGDKLRSVDRNYKLYKVNYLICISISKILIYRHKIQTRLWKTSW